MSLPNFIIIGATKSGTTSLYNYLRQHPQIYMSPTKETNFFAYENQSINFQWWGNPPTTTLNSITDLEVYKQQFANVQGEIAIGEASPYYLYNQTAALRIHHHIPQAKLIAILRHPIDRAYSNFLHLIRDGREPYPEFGRALAEEPERMKQNWAWDYFYQDMGFYYSQLKRYYDLFPSKQIKVFLYDELEKNPNHLLTEIFDFLQIPLSVSIDTRFHDNVSGYPKNKTLQRFIDQPNPLKPIIRSILPLSARQYIATLLRKTNLHKPTMSDAVQQKLMKAYSKDLLHLQDLIQQDLSPWFTRP